MNATMHDGADVRGCHTLSSHDNLEWLSGCGSLFGMLYVDFPAQQRTLKRSAKTCSDISTGKAVTPASCG
jgi:beta-glucosidase/6-phospho-beta-glucosidase/beta-galactosidase